MICPLSRDVWGLGRFEKTRTTEDKDVKFVQDAYLTGECDVSPGEFVHQVFVLLYSLIEGCKKVPTVVAYFLFSAIMGSCCFEVIARSGVVLRELE